MYRLSKEVDLSFLHGVTVLQVCIGANELIVNCDRGVRLTLLSEIAVRPPGGAVGIYSETASAAMPLVRLLHDVVVEALATDVGGLMLKFASGASLEAFDTSDQYESFWIQNGDDKIVV